MGTTEMFEVFENGMLRKKSGPKWEEVAAG
jgi:hypothetical protein